MLVAIYDGPDLIGETIRLRPFSPEDVTERYLNWLHDENVTRFIVKADPSMTLDDLAAFSGALTDSADDYFFAIVDRASDGHIGNLRIGPIDWPARASRFGILIGEPAFHNRGVGTQAVRLSCGFVFSHLGLDVLRFSVPDPSPGAKRIYEKNGFRTEGPSPEKLVRNDEDIPLITMALSRAEWQKTPPAPETARQDR